MERFYLLRGILVNSGMGGDELGAIATVTWTDKDGEEKARECYNTKTLNFVVNQLKAKNFMFFICMTSVDVAIPFRPPERHVRGA